jgi:hypothetical protein
VKDFLQETDPEGNTLAGIYLAFVARERCDAMSSVVALSTALVLVCYLFSVLDDNAFMSNSSRRRNTENKLTCFVAADHILDADRPDWLKRLMELYGGDKKFISEWRDITELPLFFSACKRTVIHYWLLTSLFVSGPKQYVRVLPSCLLLVLALFTSVLAGGKTFVVEWLLNSNLVGQKDLIQAPVYALVSLFVFT